MPPLLIHPHRRARRGVTIVELVVAITLLLLLMGIGAITATRALATQARSSAADTRAVAISDALHTLARHTIDADPGAGDLFVVRDTVLQLRRAIGITSVCRTAADTLVISTGDATLPWSTTLPRLVTDDDEVRLWHESSRSWMHRRVRLASSASGVCGDSLSPWPDRARQRLVLDSGLPGIRAGSTVRVLQRERWSLVRGGDGKWSLALASWNSARSGFGTPQPLLSPLASPSAPTGPGFAVRAISKTGVTLPPTALADAHSIIAVIRSATHPQIGHASDSVRMNVRTH